MFKKLCMSQVREMDTPSTSDTIDNVVTAVTAGMAPLSQYLLHQDDVI